MSTADLCFLLFRLEQIPSNIEAIEKLVQAGADPASVDKDGRTPLHPAASRRGYLEVVTFLLSRPAVEVNKKNTWERTPLHFACDHCFSNVVKALLDHGADPNMLDKYGDSPLHICVKKGDKRTAAVLIEQGCDINIVSRSLG